MKDLTRRAAMNSGVAWPLSPIFVLIPCFPKVGTNLDRLTQVVAIIYVCM